MVKDEGESMQNIVNRRDDEAGEGPAPLAREAAAPASPSDAQGALAVDGSSPVGASPSGAVDVVVGGEPSASVTVGSPPVDGPGFKGTSTVFWIPGGSAPGRGRLSVAERLAGLPAETSEAPPATIVVRDTDRSGPTPSSGRPKRQPFRVGAYEVAARLAQGGTGSIYLCRRAGGHGFRRLYALKVIRQHADEKDAAESFQREAFLGAFLDHPNLQRVIEVGTYEQQPFLVLDYVEGASLGDLLLDGVRPPVRAVVSIVLDVLRGLQYAHTVTDERGAPLEIVHGDISPSNVLVGVDGCARVTDFGCASLGRERRENRSRVARFGGRPSFTAPEILCGEAADARSDVFSVGVMMWQLLTGQKLFPGDSYDQTVVAVMRKRIPPPSTLGSPACLDDVCLRACVRAVDGRFASANEMAEELTRVASAQGLLAGTDEAGTWVRREWGEKLAERRRWADEAFGAASAPAAGAARDGERLPAKTIQLAAVVSASGAAGERLPASAFRWRPAADDAGLSGHDQAEEETTQSGGRLAAAKRRGAGVTDESDDRDDESGWDEEELTVVGAWWKRPWFVVGVSAALAFALTLGVAKWLERPPVPSDEKAAFAGTATP